MKILVDDIASRFLLARVTQFDFRFGFYPRVLCVCMAHATEVLFRVGVCEFMVRHEHTSIKR